MSTCESGRDTIEVIVSQSTISQSISLIQGWNLISTYVAPTDSSVATVLASIDFTIVKNADGFYKKGIASELQSLQYIQPGKGYLVYVSTPSVLVISGNAVKSYTSELKTGWNLIGVPLSINVGISTIIPSKTIQIKDFDGFYEPENSLNSISNFESGKGYYIRVSADSKISW